MLVEEAATERRQPFLNRLLIVFLPKGMSSQEEYLGGTEAETEEVIQEEVVQLIRSHQVFRLLLDIPLLVCRSQFRRYRRIDDVEQRLLLCLICRLFRHIAYQILDQRLGNAGIDSVHRHVVAVIGSPSQCQFRQVAGTDHHGVQLVGKVHQNLRPLTGL